MSGIINPVNNALNVFYVVEEKRTEMDRKQKNVCFLTSL